MAEKTTKKTVAKKVTAKKTVSKPVATKKPVAKKAAPKKVAPVAEKHACGCDSKCACGGECACAKKKCTFGRFLKKLIVIFIIFALGFVAAKMCCCDGRGKFGPRPKFENGCLVVKCPKMAQMVPMMDVDNDGCVTRGEFKAAKKQMKHKNRPARRNRPARPEMPAPAPEMAE